MTVTTFPTLVGKTVESIRWRNDSYGTLIVRFTDGTEFFLEYEYAEFANTEIYYAEFSKENLA